MASCIFCEIARGERPASRVYEDDLTLAFLDHRQANPGHVLVIPKGHYEAIYDLDNDISARLLQATVLVARAIRASLAPDGLSVWQSNGRAAGQEVFHLHIHLQPRQLGDGLLRFYGERPAVRPREELDRLAEQIRRQIPAR